MEDLEVSEIFNYNGSGGDYTDLQVYIGPGDGSEWEFTVSMDNRSLHTVEPDAVRWSPSTEAPFDAPPAKMPVPIALAWAAKRPEVVAQLEARRKELEAIDEQLGQRA